MEPQGKAVKMKGRCPTIVDAELLALLDRPRCVEHQPRLLLVARPDLERQHVQERGPLASRAAHPTGNVFPVVVKIRQLVSPGGGVYDHRFPVGGAVLLVGVCEIAEPEIGRRRRAGAAALLAVLRPGVTAVLPEDRAPAYVHPGHGLILHASVPPPPRLAHHRVVIVGDLPHSHEASHALRLLQHLLEVRLREVLPQLALGPLLLALEPERSVLVVLRRAAAEPALPLCRAGVLVPWHQLVPDCSAGVAADRIDSRELLGPVRRPRLQCRVCGGRFLRRRSGSGRGRAGAGPRRARTRTEGGRTPRHGEADARIRRVDEAERAGRCFAGPLPGQGADPLARPPLAVRAAHRCAEPLPEHSCSAAAPARPPIYLAPLRPRGCSGRVYKRPSYRNLLC
jgi:hypothetical protein